MELELTIAMSEYDHVRDLLDGQVRASGISLRPLLMSVEENFYRFLRYGEWEVGEFSFGKYAAVRSQGRDDFKAIPVFPSRMFRQSGFYVRTDSPIEDPSELRGKRIGIPTWTQSAQVYARGYLMHDCKLGLSEVEWHQSGVNEPGREENLDLELPSTISLTRWTDRSLNEMLVGGEIDAIITAHPPPSYAATGAPVRRLLRDSRAVEASHYAATGIYPIMHTIVIKQSVLDRYPWVAMNLYRGFEEAKRRSRERLFGKTASRFPVPWLAEHAAEVEEQFGGDPFSYGIEPNRVTIENFLQFAHEQHVTARRLSVEELFVDEVQSVFKV
jgi:4,5-dihydroxyphthalate decarboxylase